ncbi:Photosystem II reaction center PsbP family protein [Melia azedarach]|uniref:Photosystem II reaction center PsbP family protein n=1 Tax=Melia azedarach TaxID=155640 RepID=A0ACC1WT02_MELAZ|nr:Photosystem II reaction center PsbP family protein [Melia azedarach]
MASISSIYSLSQHPRHSCSFIAFSHNKGINKYGKQSVVCSKNHCQQEQEKTTPLNRVCFEEEDPMKTIRRRAVFQIAFTAFSFPSIFSKASAKNGDFQTYTDEVNKFEISIPQDWQVGAGEPNGFKSITAFYPPEASSSSSVSVVITGLGPDFTRMESFGKVEAFADTLVSGLDRSWQRPPGVAAKLIDCKAANGFYYIEYTLQNPAETRKHLYSAIGMASNGWYNRLYTVTGQFVDEESEKYGSGIEKAVASFRFI